MVLAERERAVLRPTKEGRRAFRAVAPDGTATKALRVLVRPLSLMAVGDVNLEVAPFPSYTWASVGPTLKSADISVFNLECAVSRGGAPVEKQYRFRGSPDALRGAARAAGLDVAVLANNHTGDYGKAALLDTVRNVRSAGMVPVGAGHDESSAYRPQIVERLGLKVAFVAFSEILPFEFRAGPASPGTAWAFPQRVRDGVRRARRQADVVVAVFHWGLERHTEPSPGQRALAGLALDAGAHAVIGHHPHVLQPIRRPDPRRVIAYSLGNFVFGAGSPGTQNTGILRVRLARRRVVGVKLLRARIQARRPVLLRG